MKKNWKYWSITRYYIKPFTEETLIRERSSRWMDFRDENPALKDLTVWVEWEEDSLPGYVCGLLAGIDIVVWKEYHFLRDFWQEIFSVLSRTYNITTKWLIDGLVLQERQPLSNLKEGFWTRLRKRLRRSK